MALNVSVLVEIGSKGAYFGDTLRNFREEHVL